MAGIDLNGAWELDRERSHSMYAHMRLLGCDEIAALASEKLNLRLHIVQTEERINVWQKSQLGVVYRALSIGKDTVEVSSQGERKVWVTVSPTEMIVDTKFKNGRLLDTRTIEVNTETGEEILTTCLQLTMRGQGGSTKTMRYFKKTGPADPEVTSTPPEGIATKAGLPYERVGGEAVKKEGENQEEGAGEGGASVQ